MPLIFRKDRNRSSNYNNEIAIGSFSSDERAGKDNIRTFRRKRNTTSRLKKKLVKFNADFGLLSSFETFMIFLGSLILLFNIISRKSEHRSVDNGVLKSNHFTYPTRFSTTRRPYYNEELRLFLSNIKTKPFQVSPVATLTSPNPHYGLKINFLTEESKVWGRTIKIDQKELMDGHVYNESDFEKGWKYFEKYYAFDDDIVRNEHFYDEKNHCRRVAWHRLYNPNCNSIHETELLPWGQKSNNNKLLGQGSYRAAFFLENVYDPENVIKVQRFKDSHYKTDRYEFVRMDALVMERLTASPRIVDIYGHCASSVLTEFLPKELEGTAVPFVSKTRQTKIYEKQKRSMKVESLNNLTLTEKIDISLQMAEAIADLHGFKDGVIVHDDIQLSQLLFTKEKKIKLNDFNRAEAMLFNEKKMQYCQYRNGAGGGDWRAPEEYADDLLNEKIDVWSFGNNVYSLLTGLYVFHDEDDYKKIKKLMLNGNRTTINDAYRLGTTTERKLVEIIEKCWTTDPNFRPSIFEIIDDLKSFKSNIL